MNWQRYNKETWAVVDETGSYKIHLVKSKHYSWWQAEYAQAGCSTVLDYGRHTKAQSAIDTLEKVRGL